LIVCGIIQGLGLHVYLSHWYLTIAYGYVWIVMPVMGFTLERFRKAVRGNTSP
jgi:hypothetical protein